VEEQVDLVRRLVRRENEQAARRLSPEDAATLRKNLAAIVDRHKVALLASPRPDSRSERSALPIALTMIVRELFRNDDTRNALLEQLTSGLSPKAQEQLDSLPGWRRNEQLWRWIRDSLQSAKVDSEQLERFFAEKLNTGQREKLLSLPPNEMQAHLERLYYATESGYGDVAEWWSEFRDSGWPPNRPGGDRRGFRPDGPPGERGRREGPPERFDRDRLPRGPGGPPRPHEFREDRRPFGPPSDGPRPDGPGRGPPPGDRPPRDG
jgi:hypothetical protein